MNGIGAWLFTGATVLVWQQLLLWGLSITLWVLLCWATGRYVGAKAELDATLENVKAQEAYLKTRSGILAKLHDTLERRQAQLDLLASELGVIVRKDTGDDET